MDYIKENINNKIIKKYLANNVLEYIKISKLYYE
jgi:hypothetical protein